MIKQFFLDIVFPFLFAGGLTYFSIPVLIQIAKAKHLFDEPGNRSSHTETIPTLGGLAIFLGFILSMTLFTNFQVYTGLKYLQFAFLVSFFLGLKDDIIALDPMKKFLVLMIAAAVIVVFGGIRIRSFYHLFGITELNYFVSVAFTIFTFLTIINAVNLIDGINGLATVTSMITSLAFGTWFYLEGSIQSIQIVTIIAALNGSLLAFLKYNVTPAKLFMGDTGSLLLGALMAFFAIEFLETNNKYSGPYHIESSPVVAMSFLVLPLVDMVKVFAIRVFKKRSPFSADRNHVHHAFLNLGFSHMQTTAILSIFTLFFIGLALVTQNLRYQTPLLVVIALVAVSLPNSIIYLRNRKKHDH